ncbi:MAG: SAM hydroxide adenosyltransferase [Burkholderiales bacterium]
MSACRSCTRASSRTWTCRLRRAWPKARSVSCTSTQHPSGNAITGIRAALARSAQSLVVRDNTLRRGRVFSDTAMGELFWYENSIGLIEIAANQASAARLLGLAVGDDVRVS